MSAIHAQITPRHKATGVTKQEDSSATILAGGRHAAEHILFGPVCATVGELFKQFLDHGGDDVAGGDGVDADVELTPFGGEVAG